LYKGFREKLERFLQDPTHISTDVNVTDAIRVVRTEMQMEATIVEEENLEIECSIGEAAMDTQPSMCSVDDALRILVQNAIKEFGYAPRDMCRGVFNPQVARDDHDAALNTLRFEDLEKFIGEFSRRQSLESERSHCILEVYPQPNIGLSADKWTVNFKSDHIAKKVLVKMREDQRLRNTYRHHRDIPIASGSAGSTFEPIVHNMLARGWESDGVQPPQPI
jgi:hypothetical protein